ncbi:MAG: insulinase family protein, partial [Candidatus Kerfeldbacteria bacterium]|nr:insulinase family protein [Candidatus Kerfeldbacteria bacterium]
MLKHWKLPNGFHVLLSPVHDTKSITVLVLIRVGSRYETPHLNGVSHFVEHLVFKGTKKRPSTLHISQELDRLGASYNAFTTKDHTGFYVKVSSRYTEIAMDIVSDIVQNAQFPAAEVERERTVIHEEINMYEDNPLMHVTDMLEYALYGKTSFLGQNIAGPKSVISDVSRADILKFWNTYYRPGNMALVLAGHITEESAHQMVKKYFTG